MEYLVEYSYEAFQRMLLNSLSNLERHPSESIEGLIMAAHIYDSFPLLTFVETPGNKTDFFIDHLSMVLRRLYPKYELPYKELQRIATWEEFHIGIRQFGYFYVFVSFFFSLYQRTTDLFFLDIALDAAEAYRAKLHPVAVRIRFWTKIHRMFELAFHDMAFLSKNKQAVTFLEQVTARGFLDIYMMSKIADLSYSEKVWGSYDVMDFIGKEVPEEPEIYSIKVPRRHSPLEDFPLYSREQLFQFVDACSAFHIDQWDLSSCRPLEVTEILGHIPENNVYLSYRQVDEKLFCIALRKDQKINIFFCDTFDFSASHLSLLEQDFAKIVRLIRRLGELGLPVHQRALEYSPPSEEKVNEIIPVLEEFYNLIFRMPNSIENETENLHEMVEPAKSVLISAAFPIQGVPIAALHNGTSFVIEKQIVAYVPNATWYALLPHGVAHISTALVLADPTSDLPGALAEGELVAEMLQKAGLEVTYCKREKVTKQWVLEYSKSFDIIHYAGHGNFHLQESSYLQLADGDLYIDEILNARWKAAFIFLNACRSGERQVHVLEETLSLASGMLVSSARAIIGTLWPIGDVIAYNFAKEFYKVLLGQRTIGEAYQNAMKNLISNSPHPATWAPFILLGDPHLLLSQVR